MWDQRFDTDEYVYGTEPNDFLASVADRIPPGRVLSLGEGEGRNAVFLATRGRRVTAVDASSVGLRKVIRLAESRGVEVETVHVDLAREVDRHVSEGRFHDGTSAVVQVLAERVA